MLETTASNIYDADSPETANTNTIQLNIQFSRINNLNNISSQSPNNQDIETFSIVIDKMQSIFDLISLLRRMKNPDNPEAKTKEYQTFFNGVEISRNSAFSLAFYGINNDDVIQVFEKDIPQDSLYDPSIQINRTNNFRSFCKGRARALEQARLHDVLFNRIEGTLLCYRKNIDRFMQTLEDKQLKGDDSETIINDSSQGPSTHMLPQIWPGEATEYSKN